MDVKQNAARYTTLVVHILDADLFSRVAASASLTLSVRHRGLTVCLALLILTSRLPLRDVLLNVGAELVMYCASMYMCTPMFLVVS